jgi:hypothetical protein
VLKERWGSDVDAQLRSEDAKESVDQNRCSARRRAWRNQNGNWGAKTKIFVETQSVALQMDQEMASAQAREGWGGGGWRGCTWHRGKWRCCRCCEAAWRREGGIVARRGRWRSSGGRWKRRACCAWCDVKLILQIKLNLLVGRSDKGLESVATSSHKKSPLCARYATQCEE